MPVYTALTLICALVDLCADRCAARLCITGAQIQALGVGAPRFRLLRRDTRIKIRRVEDDDSVSNLETPEWSINKKDKGSRGLLRGEATSKHPTMGLSTRMNRLRGSEGGDTQVPVLSCWIDMGLIRCERGVGCCHSTSLASCSKATKS